jgi:hypothetical protein
MTNVSLPAPSSARLSSVITSMTRQGHRTTANVTSATPSPGRLDSDIMPWLMSPRQHHRQQVSIATSRHDHHCLDNTITSKTRQQHHTTANVASATPLLARLNSAIASLTWQRHHVTTNVAFAMPSQTWLDNSITPWPTSPQQHLCQHWLSNAITNMTQGLGAYFPD